MLSYDSPQKICPVHRESPVLALLCLPYSPRLSTAQSRFVLFVAVRPCPFVFGLCTCWVFRALTQLCISAAFSWCFRRLEFRTPSDDPFGTGETCNGSQLNFPFLRTLNEIRSAPSVQRAATRSMLHDCIMGSSAWITVPLPNQTYAMG